MPYPCHFCSNVLPKAESTADDEAATWQLMGNLFHKEPRQQFMKFLGYDPASTKEAVRKVPRHIPNSYHLPISIPAI